MQTLDKLVTEMIFTVYAWIVIYPITAFKSLYPGLGNRYVKDYLNENDGNAENKDKPFLSPILFFIASSAFLRVVLRLLFLPGYKISTRFLEDGNQYELLVALLKVIIIVVINAFIVWVIESLITKSELSVSRFRFHFHLQSINWGIFYFAYRSLLFLFSQLGILDESQGFWVTIPVFTYLMFLQVTNYLPEIEGKWNSVSRRVGINLVLLSVAITMIIQINYKLATTVPFMKLLEQAQ